MFDNDVALSASIKTNIDESVDVKKLIDRTSKRLSSGKTINSVSDDPLTYFLARALTDRAADLYTRKQEIDQGISTLSTIVESVATLDSIISNMIGVVTSSRSTRSEVMRGAAREQLAMLSEQFQRLVEDTSYQGTNLILDDFSELIIQFSDRDESQLLVKSQSLSLSRAFRNSNNSPWGMEINDVANIDVYLGFEKHLSEYDLTQSQEIKDFMRSSRIAQKRLETTSYYLRGIGSKFSSQINLLTNRLDFTQKYVRILENGSDKMTLANITQEGTYMRALRIRQQLGMQAINFSALAEDAILQLLR